MKMRMFKLAFKKRGSLLLALAFVVVGCATDEDSSIPLTEKEAPKAVANIALTDRIAPTPRPTSQPMPEARNPSDSFSQPTTSAGVCENQQELAALDRALGHLAAIDAQAQELLRMADVLNAINWADLADRDTTYSRNILSYQCSIGAANFGNRQGQYALQRLLNALISTSTIVNSYSLPAASLVYTSRTLVSIGGDVTRVMALIEEAKDDVEEICIDRDYSDVGSGEVINAYKGRIRNSISNIRIRLIGLRNYLNSVAPSLCNE